MDSNGVPSTRLAAALKVLLAECPNAFPRIATASFALGFLGAVSMSFLLMPLLGLWDVAPWVPALGAYLFVCYVYYHMAEFMIAALYRPHDTHPDAFLLVHSKEYTLATVAAFTEFFVEALLVPDAWKLCRLDFWTVAVFGALTGLFYTVRVVAMVQCGANFSLRIEVEHRPEHVLVQDGLYRHMRHPSYFGWFWRTVFSQVLLMNPVCLVGFSIVSWKFFSRRIADEEEILASDEFFGEKYLQYIKSTRTGIPLIS